MILKRFSLLLCFLTIFNCSSNDNKVDKSLTNNQETAAMTGIPLAGYNSVLPIWRH